MDSIDSSTRSAAVRITVNQTKNAVRPMTGHDWGLYVLFIFASSFFFAPTF